MKNYHNILIVRTDRIGDVILTTPAIQLLRENFPAVKISILVSPLTYDLVRGNPYLDKIFVDDRKGVHRGFLGFWKLVMSLRHEKFDCAIIFHTKKRTNALCFLVGIPERIGYRNEKFGFLLTQPIADTRNLGIKHESEYCLDVLKAMGVPVEPKKVFLSLPREGEQWAEQFLRNYGLNSQDRLVAIHAGASGPEKRWPTKNFIDVIDYLQIKTNTKIILIGASGAIALAEEIKKAVSEPIFDVTGQTSVAQLASLLKRCHLLISNDSGPVHVADAVGIPVISIFTRNQPGINPERWRPLGKQHIVIVPPKLPPGNQEGTEVDGSEMIPTARVLEAVDAIFKLC